MELWQPFFFDVTKPNRLEISLNGPAGTSGHDFLMNVDFQVKMISYQPDCLSSLSVEA